jgi:fructose-bisphosphate aldolase class II
MSLPHPPPTPSWKPQGQQKSLGHSQNTHLWLCRDIKAPIILQVSQGGSAYYAGKGLANDNQQASILGAVAAAHHIRTVAKAYGV